MLSHSLSVFCGIHDDDVQVHAMAYTRDRYQPSCLAHKNGAADYTSAVEKTSAAAELLCYCRVLGRHNQLNKSIGMARCTK
jgi:hypothetical protein